MVYLGVVNQVEVGIGRDLILGPLVAEISCALMVHYRFSAE